MQIYGAGNTGSGEAVALQARGLISVVVELMVPNSKVFFHDKLWQR